MDKIFFVSTEDQSLTQQEITYADIWLKQRLNGSKYNYNNLSISFNVMPEVTKIVKGCFFSWFKKIESNTRLNLIVNTIIFLYTSSSFQTTLICYH